MNRFPQPIHEEWKIIDQYDSTYWSGLDVQIFVNNIFLGEAIQLNYAISERIMPYYGYSSYSPTRIHHGSRIIQGEFSINFKRDGYLFSLLSLVANQNDNDIWLKATDAGKSSPEKSLPIEYNNTPYGPDLWEQLTNNNLPAATISAIAAKYKSSRESAVNNKTPLINNSAGLFETQTEGFDLNIIFGANLNAAQSLRWQDGDTYTLEPISALERDGSVIQESKGAVASTGIKLVGVSIGGVARSINDDGRPLIETYSFQARNLRILSNVDSTTLISKEENILSNPLLEGIKSGSGPLNSQGLIGNRRLLHEDTIRDVL